MRHLLALVLFTTIKTICATQVAFDLASTTSFTGHMSNNEPALFVFTHSKPEHDLFIRVEVNEPSVELIDLYVTWNQTSALSAQDYKKHYVAQFAAHTHPAAKLRKFDLAYKDLQMNASASMPIFLQLHLYPPSSESRTFTIRIAYQLTLLEGAVLFIGYAFLTFCCFLVIPCFCLGCAFSISLLRRCCANRSSTWSWLQQQPQEMTGQRSFWQDIYAELVSILHQLEGHGGMDAFRVTQSSIEDLARKITWQDEKMVVYNHRCLVCLEDFEQGSLVRILPCKHMFHSQCIDSWLFSTSDCPKQACLLCKNPI